MPNNDNWTEGRFRAFVVSALRGATRRWPPKYNTLNAAKTEKRKNSKTGRMAQHYRCAGCGEEFVATEIEVDHIIPIASTDGFTTWDTFIERLFCDSDNLQVLCKACHKEKTKRENLESKNLATKPKRTRKT